MNRLSKETSPYLKQHENNPVDWYPWGEEALKKARDEDKPILLSIGYSACHWCHVMEHESFENAEIAALMNQHFVSIKVDREERPDLDQIYQNVAQLITRGGGWPLTVFLTPDLKPFYGGTYFPPEDRYGRPGFPRVLAALADAFHNQKESVSEQADQITQMIGKLETTPSHEGDGALKIPSIERLDQISESLVDHVDLGDGGFGGAPKFPNTMAFSFLWRMGEFKKSNSLKDAVLITLRKMASGGIYDQIGGGFHRYSVDASWSVPHFEKMLYDNGLLLKLYSEVLLERSETLNALDRELFTEIVSRTVEYVSREMTSPDGGFYSAQDADSEGEEGKFFVWDLNDLNSILEQKEAHVFSLRYGVREGGNFEHGKTVLYLANSISEVQEKTGLSEGEVRSLLSSAKDKLYRARKERVAPARDEKVLTAWNGLMISGLAWASQALEASGRASEAAQARSLAERAFQFITGKLTQGDRLMSTYQAGSAKVNAYLDDYAFMAMAALDLARVGRDFKAIRKQIEISCSWIQTILKHFSDQKNAGYFFTSDDHEKLIQRPKTIYDQAIPSGTAVTLSCMAALSEIDPEIHGKIFTDELESQLTRLFPASEQNAFGCGELLCAAMLFSLGPVVVSGPNAGSACTHPHIFQRAARETQSFLVCHRKTCSLPLQNVESLKAEAIRKTTSLLA